MAYGSVLEAYMITNLTHTHTYNTNKKRDINPSSRYVLISTVIPNTSEEAAKRKEGQRREGGMERQREGGREREKQNTLT